MIKIKGLFKLNSLRKKFTLVVAILLLGVFVAKGYVEIKDKIVQTRNGLEKEAIAFAELSTKPLGEAYDLYFESGYFKFRQLFEELLDLNGAIKRIQFIDVNGRIILDSIDLGEERYLAQQEEMVSSDVLQNVRSDKLVLIRNPKNANEVTEIFNPYFTDWGSHPYTIRYFVSYEKIAGLVLQIILQSLILVFIFFVLAVLLITGAVNKLILAPISTVSKAAIRISQGKYGERIKVDTNDEIEQLADASNKMARALERDIIELRELDKLKDEFIDIAANNLKIPLNHLKFNIAFLLKTLKNRLSKKEYEILEDTERNYNELQLLGEDLINITTLKKGKMETGVFVPIDLSQIIKEVVQEMQPAIAKKGLTLKMHILKSAPILGDYLKIKQVFLNLVDNAIKYNKKKGTIFINLKEANDSYCVEVADTGVGMTKEEVAKLFQKFYRAPSSAQYYEQGTGLGLYLSQLIIEVHHGKIWAESESGKGSKFSVSLLKKEVFQKKYPFK